MIEKILQYVSVLGASMLKAVLGAPLAYQLGLSILESIILTACGIMMSTILIILIGKPVRLWVVARRERLGKPKLSREINPRVYKIWKRWGMVGVAFFTPILLSPLGGAFTAVTLGVHPKKIVMHMAWSSILWSVIYSYIVYLGGYALR